MAALEDVLGRYNQSNFDIGAAAAAARSLGAKYGLTEAELAAAVPIFGDFHRQQFNSGYTEGSNYNQIAQSAVEDALRARGQNAAVVAQQNPNFVSTGAAEANQRWQATQKDDGGLFGDLGPLAQLAALIPGPQQPFLLAANAANNLSQGNLIGAGLNAFGAYSGGWDGLMGGGLPGAEGFDALSSGAAGDWYAANGAGAMDAAGLGGSLGAATTAFEAGGAGGLQNWNTLGGNSFGGDYMSLDGALSGGGAPVSEMGSIYDPTSQTFTPSLGNQVAGMTGSGMLGNLGSAASGAGSLLGGGGSLLGALGTGIAGLYGAKVAGDQTDAYKQMADQYASYGAPYRQRLSDLYANPSSFLSSPEVQKPVQMGTDMLMRSLSTQGNPFGSGNALQQGQSYASDQLFSRLGQEKDRLGGFGGLTAYNQAAPQMSQNAIASMSNAPTVLAGAVSDIFHPQPTFAETWKQFQTLSGR